MFIRVRTNLNRHLVKVLPWTLPDLWIRITMVCLSVACSGLDPAHLYSASLVSSQSTEQG